MRNWYTSQELAGLPGLPGSVPGIRKLAARLEWECRKRAASKAVEYPFACLPAETQAALMAKSVAEVVPAVVAEPEQAVAIKSDQPEIRSSARLAVQRRSWMALPCDL